jgi:dTDP-glucose 4,6-dehydratase
MRLDDGCVVPTFIRQALRDEPLTVHGEGEQTQSFCYVHDLIDGLLALMYSNVERPVNIGNPDERSILDLAEVILDLTDPTAGIIYEPRPPDDPSVRRPDISTARSELNWQPQVLLRSGLKETIEHFETRI